MFGFREDILAGGEDGELLDPGLEEEKVFTDNLEYSCLYRYTGGVVYRQPGVLLSIYVYRGGGGVYRQPGVLREYFCEKNILEKLYIKRQVFIRFLITQNYIN